jgi:hypothetical protein
MRLIQFITTHPGTILAGEVAFNLLVGMLPKPTPASSRAYRVLYRAAHFLALNFQYALRRHGYSVPTFTPQGDSMKINWSKVAQIASFSLIAASSQGHQIGSESHVAAANDAADAANAVAKAVITDPTQQAEEQEAYAFAKQLIALFQQPQSAAPAAPAASTPAA